MMIESIPYHLNDIKSLGNYLGKSLKSGDVIILSGIPGVGKSTLTYEIINLLEPQQVLTQSPTFSKVNEYEKIIHMDWYYAENLINYGPYFLTNKIILIEWGDLFLNELSWDYHWHLEKIDDENRILTITKNPKNS